MELPLVSPPATAPLSREVSARAATGPAPQRVDWVDTAKGICIGLVVLLHCTHGVENALGVKSWLHGFVAWAQPFRMPDFFLLSGVFMARALQRDRARYFDGKIVHFAYFYALWTLVQVLLKESSLIGTAGVLGFGTHVATRLFAAPIGVMWFLYVLMTFFLTAWVFRRAPAVLFALAVPLHLWDDEITSALRPIVGHMDGLVWEFCSRLVFFVGGWVFARTFFRVAEWAKGQHKDALAALALWAIANGAVVALGWNRMSWVGLVLAVAGATAVVSIASLVAPTGLGTVLRGLGRQSLVVFCTFFLGMAATRTVLLRLWPEGDAGVITLVVFAAAMIVPFVLAWAIDRFGYGRFLVERPEWTRIRRSRTVLPSAGATA